jgi:hypothetical protein
LQILQALEAGTMNDDGGKNVTRVYIGKPRIGKRGPLYCARLGSLTGPVLVKSTLEPLLAAARVLLSRGITGQAELWDAHFPCPRLYGDIEHMAKWTVREDEETSPTFVPWRPFPVARAKAGTAKRGSRLSSYPKVANVIPAYARAPVAVNSLPPYRMGHNPFHGRKRGAE